MKSLRLLLACLSFFVAGSSMATPLSLDYSRTAVSPDLYHYNFTLSLNNHDNSWGAGQGFGWLIFGDAHYGSSTPLTNFKMDAGVFPVGPWTYLSTSGGGHNGPTFGYVLSQWVPTVVGESLVWSGTSSADVAQGNLLFSTIYNANGAVGANFEVAGKAASNVPEPTGVALLALGLMALALARRRA